MGFNGKVALVIGGAHGLGRATAERLAETGCGLVRSMDPGA